MTKIALICDAGEGIGYGHWSRCQAIAEELKRKKIVCTVYLKYYGICSLSLSTHTMLYDWTNQALLADLSLQYDTVVIDSYRHEAAFYKQCSLLFRHSAVLDDFNRIVYPVELLINPNPFGKITDYANQTAKCFGGPEFVILRSAVASAYSQHHINAELSHLTVTLGGSDYRHLLPKLLNTLISTNLKISIMAGSSEYQKELTTRYTVPNVQIYSFLDAEQTAALFKTSDVVISGGGQTIHELACIGVPTISIEIDLDQKQNIEYYLQHTFLADAFQWNDPELVNKIIELLKKLNNMNMRKTLAEKGNTLIDGNGTSRIANLLIGLS